jgi:hypothetical protein
VADLPTLEGSRALHASADVSATVIDFEAANDDAAIDEAKQRFPQEHRDLREGARFVMRLKPA